MDIGDIKGGVWCRGTSRFPIGYISDCIKGEEWKIDMITEILDCINGIFESNLKEEENLFLLNDLCT